MNDFTTVNEVLIVGNVADTPTLRKTKNGTSVTNITVATQHDNMGEWHTEWHLIAFFGELAKKAVDKIEKGSLVLIKGFLQTYKWKDKNQNERESTRVNAMRFLPLGKAPVVEDHEPEVNGNA